MYTCSVHISHEIYFSMHYLIVIFVQKIGQIKWKIGLFPIFLPYILKRVIFYAPEKWLISKFILAPTAENISRGKLHGLCSYRQRRLRPKIWHFSLIFIFRWAFFVSLQKQKKTSRRVRFFIGEIIPKNSWGKRHGKFHTWLLQSAKRIGGKRDTCSLNRKG